MREILFKAKRTDNGEWMEGYIVKYPSGKCEIHKKCIELPDVLLIIEVDSSTLCQYTGLTDKNGKKIWENDIVNCIAEECCGYISWNESESGFYFCVLLEDGCYEEEHIYDYVDELEVIGNIFDNPELLGGAE